MTQMSSAGGSVVEHSGHSVGDYAARESAIQKTENPGSTSHRVTGR